MSIGLNRLPQVERSEIATTIRNAGISGAGGAGFPTHAKWDRLEEVDALLVNHQESEPNYYMDRWLGREHADELAAFFDALLESVLDVVVVGTKEKYRDRWMTDLESATGGTVYTAEDLPIDPDEESGVVFAYTEDRYEYGMESVILRIVADVVLGQDLPMDHGWIVQNTETLYNTYQAIEEGETLTHKLVHVDGDVPTHRFLSAPIGTPASTLLEAADRSPDDLGPDERLLDGGPGWCFEIEAAPETFGLRKRSNCLMVADADVATENVRGEDRVDIREPYEWAGEHETEPTTISPASVRIPLITNPAFEGIVEPSRPIVQAGDRVEQGEMIATPSGDGVGNTHHASIDGEVTEVTESHIEIQREQPPRESTESEQLIYWTSCVECGSYVVMPDVSGDLGRKNYVCEDCR